MADLIELRNRILAVHNGQLPPNAVSDDELREAIAQLREARRKRAVAAPATTTTRRSAASPALNLEAIQGKSGGLLDLLNKD
jgi:hypothetical protein